jgi:signal transduction histidine kinase/CheY-like chemotaxis protein
MIGGFANLARIGVPEGMPEREARHIIVLNVIVLFVLCVGAPNALFAGLYFQTTMWQSVGLLRRYLTARIWWSFFATFFLTLYVVFFGTESRFQLFLLNVTFVMFYIFPAGERFWMYLMAGVSSACFLAAEFLLREGGLIGGIPAQYLLAQNYFNTIGFAFCVLTMGGFGYLTLSNAEENLAREHEVTQDKTRQLEIANRHKSHLIASASHDLRQPLHALNLFVARLRDEPDPAERSRLVARIDASVGSMNELFGSLLDMTRLEAGIVEPIPTVLPVRRLLDRIETTFGEAAHKKGLRLRVVASRAWMVSDPILLERILLNLVSNAVRYTEQGGVVVGCRRRGATLRIDVCDTGPGIPEGQRRSIFGEFYQLARPEARRGEGLGLGLAIVDRLCRLLGHRVDVDSEPGRGSRFSVTVPLAAEPRAADEIPVPPWRIADPARGKRIMVIDDDTLVLDGMRAILQGWGCQVATAVSGDAALARLKEDGARPDLIISDSRLADGETGLDAIARLRAAAGMPIPALVITGDTAPERLREASAAGFPLLHKPVSPMALRTALNRLLKASAPFPYSGTA